MNTPQEQADLYRKAAETIEMCAPHGIEPIVKVRSTPYGISKTMFYLNILEYEFPITVIEGKLVWVGDIVYDSYGRSVKVEAVEYWQGDSEISIKTDGRWYLLSKYTLIPPKQPLCEVEGKPVYKGDDGLYNENFPLLFLCKVAGVKQFSDTPGVLHVEFDGIGYIRTDRLSWNPPKRTVMVELSVERAGIYASVVVEDELVTACRKALDNLKG